MIYHTSGEEVEYPEIRISGFTKDFSWGFYCTENHKQAEKWAHRIGTRKNKIPTINYFSYTENKDLKILKFAEMNDEWLDFIVKCRSGETHEYDIVEGPMADDTIWNFVDDFIDGVLPRHVFWELIKFSYPTHQMSFHTLRAIKCLTFERSETIDE